MSAWQARAARATLTRPLTLAPGREKHPAPRWTHAALWPAPPAGLYGLAAVEHPGVPSYDPGARAWYASANGCLVRLNPSGSLPVLGCGVQGVDVDVRGRQRVALSREPDHRLVLHRPGRAEPRTLLRGSRFFGPRLSPDGKRALVSESRPRGGRVWLVALDSGRRRDLGRGVDPTWRPDGRSLILSLVRHNGQRVTGADLWQVDALTGARRPLHRPTRGVAEVAPAVSPDGRWLAFVDAHTGALLVAPMPRRQR